MTPRTIAALIALTLCCVTVLIAILCKGDVRAAIKIPFASFSLETKERLRRSEIAPDGALGSTKPEWDKTQAAPAGITDAPRRCWKKRQGSGLLYSGVGPGASGIAPDERASALRLIARSVSSLL
ncbi:MAG: hypothetical protein ABSC93_12020 [Bryobacteraceae bacterium]